MKTKSITNHNQEELDYRFIHISPDQNPAEFFSWCLKHKLYKTSKDINFTSHLMIIYQNTLERFGGCQAIVAFSRNKPDKPIGICFVKHFIDNRPLNKQFAQVFDLLVSDKFQSVEADKTFYAQPLNSKNKKHREYNNKYQLFHSGHLMLYVKKQFRNKGIASTLTKLMENQLLFSFLQEKEYFQHKFKTYDINSSIISITAQEKALKIAQENLTHIIPTFLKPSDLNFSKFIQECAETHRLSNIFQDNNMLDKTIKNFEQKLSGINYQPLSLLDFSAQKTLTSPKKTTNYSN